MLIHPIILQFSAVFGEKQTGSAPIIFFESDPYIKQTY